MTESLWFDLVFVVGTQGRVVETCDTMWHHGHLMDWLEGIVREEACPVLKVDREGEIDRLEARHIDTERVHLVIADWEDTAHPFIDAVVSRKRLVWEVYRELQHWSERLKQSCRYKEHIDDKPGWLRLPSVESWLDSQVFRSRLCNSSASS